MKYLLFLLTVFLASCNSVEFYPVDSTGVAVHEDFKVEIKGKTYNNNQKIWLGWFEHEYKITSEKFELIYGTTLESKIGHWQLREQPITVAKTIDTVIEDLAEGKEIAQKKQQAEKLSGEIQQLEERTRQIQIDPQVEAREQAEQKEMEARKQAEQKKQDEKEIARNNYESAIDRIRNKNNGQLVIIPDEL
jgi:hypothetical protein